MPEDGVLEIGVAEDVGDKSQDEGQSQEKGHHPGDALALVVAVVVMVLVVTVDAVGPADLPNFYLFMVHFVYQAMLV